MTGPLTGQLTGRLPVVLDVGPAVHQSAGLARYAERLALALWQTQRAAVDLTLFYNRHSGHRLPPALAAVPGRRVGLGQYAWRLGALASQLLRLPLLDRRLPAGGIFHATEHLLPALSRPAVLTVHDLIFERFPQHHTRTNRAFLRVAMPLFVGRADAIIAVSQHTRRDLVELYRTPPEKVHVIYQGIDARFRPADATEIQRVGQAYAIERPYLLMLGTLEPRKNHAVAFQALARLKAAGHPHRLVVAGGQGWLFADVQQQVEALGLAGDVIFTGRVAEADLPGLYSGAACLLMPSLYEGFGFPVLEAMACGTPVVCSSASSLPEAAGDAALLVEPTDAEALAAAVARVLGDPALAEQMRADGLAQAGLFRWERTAAETVAVYQNFSH